MIAHHFDLKIEDTAAAALRGILKECPLECAVLTVVKDMSKHASSVNEWHIAIYDRSNLTHDANVVSIGEFCFYIDPNLQRELNGAKLEYADGSFVVSK